MELQGQVQGARAQVLQGQAQAHGVQVPGLEPWGTGRVLGRALAPRGGDQVAGEEGWTA